MSAADNFFDALFDDTFNYVNNIIPIPKELIKWGFNKMRLNPNNKYLDVNFERILDFYKQDRDALLKLEYNGETEYLPQYVEIDNTDMQLEMKDFIFDFTNEVFQLPPEVQEYTFEAYKRLTKSMKYTNEENLRLSNLSFDGSQYRFHTQPVYYQCYLQSNMVMDYKTKNEKSLREKVHKNNSLERINESMMANHLGINILLFTPGGYLIMPMRSEKVSYAPSELSASISGAVSTNDVVPDKSFDSFSIIREGIEELGITRNDIIKETITFLGMTRELIRGGKPELFFTMQTTLNKKDIETRWKKAKDKWENKKILFYPFEQNVLENPQSNENLNKFNEKINELLENHGSKMSLPFITNLALLKKLKNNQLK